jgi:hypothetical protein
MTTEPEDTAAIALPPRTTPTWEMELLVSGATIFGLLQLPALIDHAYARALNLAPQDYIGLVSPLWIYTKFAVITLVITFIAHLFLRGYWVALVGLDSVYPGGIRWDRVESTPLARAAAEANAPSMPALIERADNRASRVFGIGYGFAMVMLMPVALVILSLAIGMTLDAIAGPGHAGWVFGTVVAVLMGPWALARAADRFLASRPRGGEGRAARVLSRVLGAYDRIGLSRGSNPLVALFVSHEGRQRAGLVGLLIGLPVLAFLMGQVFFSRGQLPMGFFVGLDVGNPASPDTSPREFYADSAPDRLTMMPLPHIPSRVASGPYVELFIPFLPRNHGPAMEAACPKALAVRDEPGATRARLDCLAKLVDLQLDGKPLPLRLDATSDPASLQPGMVAMVPVEGLAPGRHELSLLSPTRPGRTPRRYRIPFWK